MIISRDVYCTVMRVLENEANKLQSMTDEEATALQTAEVSKIKQAIALLKEAHYAAIANKKVGVI